MQSSLSYELVREYIGDVAGLRILEVACGRDGFVRQVALAGAHVTGCAGNHDNVLDPGIDLGLNGIVDHRPVIYWQEVLVGNARERVKA